MQLSTEHIGRRARVTKRPGPFGPAVVREGVVTGVDSAWVQLSDGGLFNHWENRNFELIDEPPTFREGDLVELKYYSWEEPVRGKVWKDRHGALRVGPFSVCDPNGDNWTITLVEHAPRPFYRNVDRDPVPYDVATIEPRAKYTWTMGQDGRWHANASDALVFVDDDWGRVAGGALLIFDGETGKVVGANG